MDTSKSPIYDVLYVIRDSQDLDAALPEMIPVLPPDTTWDFFPTWFGNQPEKNPQVYMTFRDKRGMAWQRDTHGRLTSFRRNVDDAPPADPVSGRISYDIRNQPAGLASSVAATEEVVAERLRDEDESARQRAAEEHGVSNQLSNDRSRQRRTPADEGGRHAEGQREDPKS